MPMYSRLFRHETSRRLRAISDRVVDTYLERRYTWMNAFSRPSRDGIREYMAVLADAVERDDATRYHEYTVGYLRDLLSTGTAPIALLAAGDLLQDAVLELLTPDQRELVWEVVAQDREQRQTLLRDWLAEFGERGA
jgi:hypothetical protein